MNHENKRDEDGRSFERTELVNDPKLAEREATVEFVRNEMLNLADKLGISRDKSKWERIREVLTVLEKQE